MVVEVCLMLTCDLIAWCSGVRAEVRGMGFVLEALLELDCFPL